MYELFIALRHLTSRKRQTILSVMAIGLAVMILMVSQALMVGFTQEFYAKTVDKMAHVTVEPKSGEDNIHLYNMLAGNIRNIEGVVGVSPVLAGQATFANKERSRNVILQGILVNEHDPVLHINKDIVEGSFRDLEITHNSVVLGDKLAEKLDLKIGDSVDASFPEANPATLKVVGIYDSGTSQDEKQAYTSLSTAQDFFDVPNVVNSILIRVDHPDNAKSISDKVDLLGYPASDWKETNPEIMQTIMIESMGNNIMLGLVIIIASFGIISTLVMVVMEKTKEIGMMMAMGATRRSIMTIFLMESAILGLVGSVLGVATGVFISLMTGSYTYEMGEEFYAGVSTIPFIVRTQDAVLIVLLTSLLNLIAGIYPARYASKLDPVEAISVE